MQERTAFGLSDGLGVTAPKKGQRIRRMLSMCGVGFFGSLDNLDFVFNQYFYYKASLLQFRAVNHIKVAPSYKFCTKILCHFGLKSECISLSSSHLPHPKNHRGTVTLH